MVKGFNQSMLQVEVESVHAHKKLTGLGHNHSRSYKIQVAEEREDPSTSDHGDVPVAAGAVEAMQKNYIDNLLCMLTRTLCEQECVQ